MTIEKEVLEFIIVPPYARRSEIFAAKERMEAYLGNRFPGHSFKIARLGPVGDDDDFCILPVMNFIDAEGVSRMCTPPKPWLMADISAACREFDAGGRRSFAA
ncbi:hypothetical protein KYK29_04950 [Shinella daejeonensis]|uniref:hypothetical protein n=1 Tax=Shinella daejeonensis TaxID=659017 RepID=UPI0020C809C5|nr:hypothetical protein [Shinella daejeonensis]MCP8894268.1 hypothetical protein [Shinella daejeonensis]